MSKFLNEKLTQCEALQQLTKSHVDSFNYMLEEGLHNVVQNILPMEYECPGGLKYIFSIQDVQILSPRLPESNRFSKSSKIFPSECRQEQSTYKGDIVINLLWTCETNTRSSIEKCIGQIPIMVRSNACHLVNMNCGELIQHGEEAEEAGGYFIVNGQEKIIRMLILPRRNFPICHKRSSWKSRGKEYTEYGISVRCVRQDQSAINMNLHYLRSGCIMVSFNYNRQMYFVPLIMVLKGLLDLSDKEIYDSIIIGNEEDSFYKRSASVMLQDMLQENLFTRLQILCFLGERFHVMLHLPSWYMVETVGEFLLNQCICVHLRSNRDKFNFLVYMVKKLLCFTKGSCMEENADNPMNQELLVAGHLIQMLLKMFDDGHLENFSFMQVYLAGPIRNAGILTRPFEYLLATGNLMSRSGLGLLQANGLSVVADRLNFYRFLSHFRCVHRGSFFMQMRTTAVRKLHPEHFGFICPMHTPDGTPCGLLNHLSAQCEVVNKTFSKEPILYQLENLGMCCVGTPLPVPMSQCYPVLFDGSLVGYLPEHDALVASSMLRSLKVCGLKQVPPVLEITLVPKTDVSSQYPGLYLFSTPARMIRPVFNLHHDKVEWIGTFEQVYMHVAIKAEDVNLKVTEHMELSEQCFLSVIASTIPFSDHNPSPRNIYQCQRFIGSSTFTENGGFIGAIVLQQHGFILPTLVTGFAISTLHFQMAKQTMGTPFFCYPRRADNKIYRIITPQIPLVHTQALKTYNLEQYPLGTNAVVAVISATGCDMEDAMIINRASYERGLFHGCIYKSEMIDLMSQHRQSGNVYVFGCDKVTEGLDDCGLPFVGHLLKAGDPLYSYINVHNDVIKVERYSGPEDAYVEQVKCLGSQDGEQLFNKACIVLRIVRNPTIGDKFSSRHGQKGICSMLWNQEDMPFTASGMVPDILFNPHGYPSRMTIGMMIESLAGKSATLHGLTHDATPFIFSEDQPAYSFYGELLHRAGFSDMGTEAMYCGETGRLFDVRIFIGIIYYQRLRHMVSDKYQVRSTGPVDPLTRQPVQGRKRMGGVRLGEMERDNLISHGTSCLLHDRLFNCSDRSIQIEELTPNGFSGCSVPTIPSSRLPIVRQYIDSNF